MFIKLGFRLKSYNNNGFIVLVRVNYSFSYA